MTSNDPLTTRIAELSRVTDDEFAALSDRNARNELLSSIVRHPAVGTTGSGRRRRLGVVAAVGATAVAAGGAIAWAITSSGATDNVSIECEINGADSIIPASSGDPVADCAAQWRRDTGTTAPRLVAYDNGHGAITVAPASQPPAPGSSPLPAGTVQNVSAITLQETLDDYVAGLKSTCRSADGASAFVRQELDAAGLTGWTVSPPPGGADGTTSCADTAIVEATSRTVLLRAFDGPGASNLPFMKLANRLRGLSGCDSAGALTRRVRAIATDLGLSEAAHEFQLTTVSASGHCAVVHETVGGTIFLTVRGRNR